MTEKPSSYAALRALLRSDCAKCAGLCCTALYFAKSEGFPKDKEAGLPCVNLAADNTCKVHDSLNKRGLRGCIAYECLGAGQRTLALYGGQSWRVSPTVAAEQFAVFTRVCTMQQMLWYLIEAASYEPADADALIAENLRATGESPAEVQAFALEEYRTRVNDVLRRVVARVCGKPAETFDYFGKNFKGARLQRRDFSMALLIAANLSGCDLRGASLLGADLRDANLCGANLSESLFLTQAQIACAKGDKFTRLPLWLSRPAAW